MSEVRVEKVDREAGQVGIMVMNVLFQFWRKPDGKLNYTKSKPGSRTSSSSDMWVPAWAFKDACKQAASILREIAEEKKRGK